MNSGTALLYPTTTLVNHGTTVRGRWEFQGRRVSRVSAPAGTEFFVDIQGPSPAGDPRRNVITLHTQPHGLIEAFNLTLGIARPPLEPGYCSVQEEYLGGLIRYRVIRDAEWWCFKNDPPLSEAWSVDLLSIAPGAEQEVDFSTGCHAIMVTGQIQVSETGSVLSTENSSQPQYLQGQSPRTLINSTSDQWVRGLIFSPV